MRLKVDVFSILMLLYLYKNLFKRHCALLRCQRLVKLLFENRYHFVLHRLMKKLKIFILFVV